MREGRVVDKSSGDSSALEYQVTIGAEDVQLRGTIKAVIQTDTMHFLVAQGNVKEGCPGDRVEVEHEILVHLVIVLAHCVLRKKDDA